MQKKEIEKIPPLKAEKAADGYKATAVSKAIKIKKADYLIIDIFENKKKSLSRYIVRIVLNNKEYANHFPDGRWTEQKIRTKSYDYIWESSRHNVSIREDEIFISPESTILHYKNLKDTIECINSIKKYTHKETGIQPLHHMKTEYRQTGR